MFGEFTHSALFTTSRKGRDWLIQLVGQFDVFTGLLEGYAGIEKSNRNQAMRGILVENWNYIK